MCRCIALLCVLSLTSAAFVQAQQKTLNPVFALMDAEGAFARAGKIDFTAAFAHYLAEDAERNFGGKFVRSNEGPPAGKGAALEWQLAWAEVSAGADFGYTTGPWRYQDSTGVVETGHYISLWQKQDSIWRVIADFGVETPAPKFQMGAVISYLPKPATTAWPDSAAAVADVAAAERKFATRSATPGFGLSAAYRGAMAKDAAGAASTVRFIQAGKHMLRGAGAAKAMWAVKTKAIITPVGHIVAPSADFALAWGTTKADKKAGWYTRVWRRDSAGFWRIVAEMIKL